MTTASAASFLTSDGVRLNLTDKGDGLPVVLLAGHTAPLGSWAPLEAALLDRGRRVVAVDRRHNGNSDFPGYGLRIARQGADLHELLVDRVRDPAVLVGSSMGASAIWSMLDLFGTAGLRGLVFVDQSPKVVNSGGWKLGLYDLTWRTLSIYVATYGSPWPRRLRRFHRPTPATYSAELMPMIQALQTPYPHKLVRPLLRDHLSQDWRDVLPRIDVPTLVIAGRHSELYPVEHAEAVAAAVPGSELRILERSGHAPMFSEPEAFNDAVATFVDQLAG